MTTKEMQIELKHIVGEIHSKKSEIKSQISQYDLQEQDLLHCLEFEKCDAVKLVKISTYLKDLRAKRRRLKIEFEQAQSLSDSLKNNVKSAMKVNLEHFENKDYQYKTDVVVGIVNRHKGDIVKSIKRN